MAPGWGRYVASDLRRVREARNNLKSTYPYSQGQLNGAAGGYDLSVDTSSSMAVAEKGVSPLISTRQAARHTEPNALECRDASRARRVSPQPPPWPPRTNPRRTPSSRRVLPPFSQNLHLRHPRRRMQSLKQSSRPKPLR